MPLAASFERNLLRLLTVVALAIATEQMIAAGDDMNRPAGDPLPQGARTRLGTLRWRHTGRVHFIQFVNGGRQVVSAADDRYVRLWDTATGKELRRFGPGPRVEQIPRPGDGHILQNIERVPPDLVAISRDGKYLATRFEPKVVDIHELATGKKVKSLALGHESHAGAMAFAPDGAVLAIIGLSGPIRLWDTRSGEAMRQFGEYGKTPSLPVYDDRLPSVVFANNGQTLISVVRERETHTITLWDKNGTSQSTFSFPSVTSPVTSSDGVFFAFATKPADTLNAKGVQKDEIPLDGSEVWLMQPTTGKLVQKWTRMRTGPVSLAFSADGSRLYAKPRGSKGLQERDAKTGQTRELTLPLADHEWGWRQGPLAVSPDGKVIAVSGSTNIIRFFDLATGAEVGACDGHSTALKTVTYTADAKTLITSTSDSGYRTWDGKNGKHLKEFSASSPATRITTANGGYAARVEDRRGVIALSKLDGEKLVEIPGTGYPFFFSPDDRTLLRQSRWDTQALLFQVPSGKELLRVNLPLVGRENNRGVMATVFFAPDGKRFAVYSYGETRSLSVHDAATGHILKTILPGQHGGLRGAAFFPDGRTVALAQSDGRAYIFELATGKARCTCGSPYEFKTERGTLSSLNGNPMWSGEAAAAPLAFSPDGKWLAHAGLESVLGIWDVAKGESAARFSGHEGRITAVAFGPDSQTVTSAATDTTAVVWDVSKLSAKVVPRTLGSEEIKTCWKDLAGGDAAVGNKAINALAGSPAESIEFLKTALHRVQAVVIDALIDEIDSNDFKRRQSAQAKLYDLGGLDGTLLSDKNARKLPLETSQRLKSIQARLTLESLAGERLRLFRAIEVLERIGNAPARQLLEELAAGATGTLITSESSAALNRLAK